MQGNSININIKSKIKSLILLVLVMSLVVTSQQTLNRFHRSHADIEKMAQHQQINDNHHAKEQHGLTNFQFQANHQSTNQNQSHESLIEMGIVWTMIISIAGGILCFALVWYFFKWRNESSQTYVHQPNNNQYGNQYNTMPNNQNYNQYPGQGPQYPNQQPYPY